MSAAAIRGPIIDGDGHVMEDIPSILKYMPEAYVGKSFSEVNTETCKRAVAEVLDSPKLSAADKEAILRRNAERLSRLPAG